MKNNIHSHNKVDLTNVSVSYESKEDTTGNSETSEQKETPIYEQIPNAISIDGIATTTSRVGQFVYSLNKVDYFKSVELTNSKKNEDEGNYTFNIVLVLREGGVQVIKNNSDKKSILQRDLSAKETLIAVAVFGVVFAYGYLCIYPQYQNYKSKVSTIEDINEEIIKYENSISELPIKKERLDNLNREKDKEQNVSSQYETFYAMPTTLSVRGDYRHTREVMYSSENTMLELENDNPSKWKPGKYNPFTTTTR